MEIKAWKDQFPPVDAEHTRVLKPAICRITVFTGTLAEPILDDLPSSLTPSSVPQSCRLSSRPTHPSSPRF